jgi:hypothetical protein
MKGFTTIELIFAVLIIGIVGVSVYGLVLAFKASIILGIIALIVEPSPLVFGMAALYGTNVPEAIQNWINFPV